MVQSILIFEDKQKILTLETNLDKLVNCIIKLDYIILF